MSGRLVTAPDLSIMQIRADLVTAKSCLKEAENNPPKLSKYLRGQCGYHLQQACEKMIKIQLYASIKTIDYSKVYKHALADIATYARAQGVALIIPAYVEKRAETIISWESEGRYDTHMVVKTTTLKRCLSEVETWYDQLYAAGFR